MRNSLVGVLTRFRLYKYALISDIRKLYYQCLVDKNDQDFLRFLWYKNNDPSQPIVPCRMMRLSFGLLCVQSAALFCLEKALKDNATNASLKTILLALKSFYVDDGLFSFDNEESLLLFYCLHVWGWTFETYLCMKGPLCAQRYAVFSPFVG